MISAGGAQTIGPTSGGKVTPINNLGTTALQVIGPNQYRSSLSFFNPGVNTVYVAPLINASGVPFTPTLAALGGTIPIFSQSWVSFSGECAQAWQAFASTGVNNPLTVVESNV